MAEHITAALRSVPASVPEVVARADARFYCREVVEGIEGLGERYSYILSADKTTALVRQLEEADWKKWAGTGGVCEFGAPDILRSATEALDRFRLVNLVNPVSNPVLDR